MNIIVYILTKDVHIWHNYCLWCVKYNASSKSPLCLGGEGQGHIPVCVQYDFWLVTRILYSFYGGCSYEGDSICNENPFVSPSTNELGFCAIYQTKDQSIAFIMVQETIFYLSKFNKLQTLSTLIYTAYIFLQIVKTNFNKGRKTCCIF